MALSGMHKLGVGLILSATGKGYVDEMGKARDATGKFIKTVDLLPPGLKQVAQASQHLNAQVQKMRGGFSQIGDGLQNVALGTAPIAAGLALGVREAANFEHQMKAVQSKTWASSEEMIALADHAKKMGIETQFAPGEVARQFELMGQAGAKFNDIIAGSRGVIDAAAAEQMDLAQATDIVSQSIKIMGLKWGDSQRVADVLALAASEANTTIAELGQAMVYGGQEAKQFGMSIEDTVAMLARFADSGLKGSLGGTALTNMLIRLVKRSEKTQDFFKKNKISLVKDDKKSLRAPLDIISEVMQKLSKIKNEAKKLEMATEIFGIRGKRGFAAFGVAGKEGMLDFIEQLGNAGDVSKGLGDSIGAAQKMAEKRLEGFTGTLILFKGSIQTFAIEALENLNKAFGGLAKQGLDTFNNFLAAFAKFDDRIGPLQTGLQGLKDEFGSTTIEIVMGIKAGLQAIGNGITTIVSKVKQVGVWLESVLGQGGAQKLAKFATIAIAVAAALGPIMLALWPIKLILGGLITIFAGIKAVALAAFWPVTVAVLFLGGLFAALKEENETWIETIVRVFGVIKDAIMTAYDVALKPFITGVTDVLGPALEDIGAVFRSLGESVRELFGTIFDNISMTGDQMGSTFHTVGGMLVTVFSMAVKFIANTIKVVVELIDWLLTPVRFLLQFVHNLAAAFGTMAGGEVVEGFKRLGLALVDFLIMPLRTVGRQLIKLAEAIGADDLIPDSVRTVIDKGFTGLVFGEDGEGDKAGPKIAAGAEKASKKQIASMAEIMAKKPAEAKDSIVEGFAEGVYSTTPTVNVAVDSKLCVDGEAGNQAFASHKKEVKERMGTKFTPYQHRMMTEQGAEPA